MGKTSQKEHFDYGVPRKTFQEMRLKKIPLSRAAEAFNPVCKTIYRKCGGIAMFYAGPQHAFLSK